MNDHDKTRDQLLQEIHSLRRRLEETERLEAARQQAEKALQASEQRFRALVENSWDGVTLVDAAGRITYFTPATTRGLGYEVEEYIGRPGIDYLHPDDVPTANAYFFQLLQAPGCRLTHQYRMRHKDGSWRWVEAVAANLLHDPAVQALVFNHRDITEQKEADEALRQSNEALQALIQASPSAIYALDTEGNLLSWNPAAERIFGWRAGEVLGLPSPMVPPDKLDEVKSLRERVLRGEWFSSIEASRRKKDGSAIEVSLAAAPLRDARGRVTGIMALAADITDRKLLQERLRQAQEMEAVGRLAGGVAHDFNNLLTVITGYSELLLDDLPPADPAYNPIREIHRAGDRAALLTRQLLAYSRRQVLAPVVLDLRVVVGALEKMLQRLIGADVELSTRFDSDLGMVQADPGQIEQVLLNLIANARDAMPGGGRLTIEGRNAYLDAACAARQPEVRPGHYSMLVVSDTGCGMDEETRAFIFEPFFTTKEIGKGTGLGLPMVYGIVKQSGGHIEVASALGEGTTFRIYLPHAARADAPAPKPDLYRAPQGKETILLVEDEEGVRVLARLALQTNGYNVLEAPDGAEALAACDRFAGPIDLLLTDLVMPKMSGRHLADKLLPRRPGLRVLYMSGYTGDAALHQGVGEGAAFLMKPFTPTGLAKKVREVLDANNTPHQERL